MPGPGGHPGGHHGGHGGPRPPMGGMHHPPMGHRPPPPPPMGGGMWHRPPRNYGCCGCLLPILALMGGTVLALVGIFL